MFNKQTTAIAVLFIILSFTVKADHLTASAAYASMALVNDDTLCTSQNSKLYPPAWTKNATIVQGIPRGDTVPADWAHQYNIEHPDSVVTSTTPWEAMTVWFVAIEAEENLAHHYQIAIGQPEVWILKKEQTSDKAVWTQINNTGSDILNFSWATYFEDDLVHPTTKEAINLSSDSQFKKYNSDRLSETAKCGYPIHGGTNMLEIGSDPILGVFVRVKAWLSGDDTTSGQGSPSPLVLLSVGADYYPTISSAASDFSPLYYLPGAGGSRYAYLTSEPKWYYMATVRPENGLPVVDETSAYYQNGGKTYLTRKEWMEDTPPVLTTD
ncbi:hypothetical protein [Vibrio salinus]|uniref:hypothetical protein n=1 Tax=Vibrio salinus TaxID=2899784 RepID=UPI001E534302|nr:hypothetical protein [Vibrio salinus]MCE0494164.1 hypothetical protein [Vibrio salinus]